jgi:hypothetical protein
MTVRESLRDAIPPARAHGDGPGRGNKRLSDTNSFSDQPDASYVVSRLKRDNPDIAADVINGTITPNAAAMSPSAGKPLVERWTFRTKGGVGAVSWIDPCLVWQ